MDFCSSGQDRITGSKFTLPAWTRFEKRGNTFSHFSRERGEPREGPGPSTGRWIWGSLACLWAEGTDLGVEGVMAAGFCRAENQRGMRSGEPPKSYAERWSFHMMRWELEAGVPGWWAHPHHQASKVLSAAPSLYLEEMEKTMEKVSCSFPGSGPEVWSLSLAS